MAIDTPAADRPFAVQRLWPAERRRIRDHLLRLAPEDRRLRFCRAAGDRAIADHCDAIDWPRACVLGAFVEGELRGVAELIRIEQARPPAAELALSVEGPYQNRGIGSALLRHALTMARNRLIGSVTMLCLPENRKMRRVALKFSADLAIRDGQVDGEILAPWPSGLSLAQEAAAEGLALIRAALEVPPAAAEGAAKTGPTGISTV